jgi:thiol:disulfide interchange protein/DsbC/DsbD-like thiol-disulfide interchange protein
MHNAIFPLKGEIPSFCRDDNVRIFTSSMSFYNHLMDLRRSLRALPRLATAMLAFMLCAATPAVRAQLTEVGDGGPGPVKAPHLTVELTSLSPQVAAGGQVQAGLVITIEEHWHVYWVNAGFAGEPPKIRWTLPQGITTGPLQFPPPSQLPLGPYMDYGYEDHVALPFTVTASPSLKPGKVHLDAHVNWQVCSNVCLPGKAHLGLDLDVAKGPLPAPAVVGTLGTAITSLPRPLRPDMSVDVIGGAKEVVFTLKTGGREAEAELYPFDSGQISDTADQTVEPLPDGIRVRVPRAHVSPESDQLTPLPATIHGLFKLTDTEAYDFTAKVVPGEVPTPTAGAKKGTDTTGATSVTLFGAIGLAFLGGLILNLMPCVFPVLFIKGMALVNSSTEERGRQRTHGLVYTLGIVASFWVVVAVLLVLRTTGKELGWGFQLQSPAFVAVLAGFFFFLALSLAGQFELGLSLTSAGGGLAQKQGLAGSFFTGVLATVVATPCTGPLMGAAIGFALAQPAWLTFLVFTALALGLALPYLALTMQPQWTKILPRPGAWMEVFKQLTSVILFITAIWLTWVFGHLYANDGIDRMVALLACFLVLAIAGWVLGRWPAKWGSAIVAAVLILGGLFIPLRKPAVETLIWQPYTQANFDAARASGKPIFIDFTAAWCLSCQVNERAVLRSKDIESKLIDNHVQLLKADWTQYDPQITQELAAVGRSGVPTYVIYPGGKNSNADVLPELLTKDIVLKAIEKDSKTD